MSKAYWVGHVDIHDLDSYMAYPPESTAAIKAYGGTFLARGQGSAVEGSSRGRHVIVEFPDLDTAQKCYDSEEYKKARALRQPFSDADLVIVEGL